MVPNSRVLFCLGLVKEGLWFLFSFRLAVGFLVNKYKLNKVLVWSIANLFVGVCGIAVTYTEDVNSVIILGAVTGRILKGLLLAI